MGVSIRETVHQRFTQLGARQYARDIICYCQVSLFYYKVKCGDNLSVDEQQVDIKVTDRVKPPPVSCMSRY